LHSESSVLPGEAWRDLRRRSRFLWQVLFASLPGIFLFSWLLDGALRQSLLLPLVTLAFVTAIGVAGLRVARFACPGCGKPFFENWYFLKLLRIECAYCGLARESGEPAPK
jgi:hypothetical protein